MKIGIFDSGLGGLSIFKELLKAMPEYDYLYLGDNARTPYGGRSPELIYEFTKNAVHFLFKKDCEIIILACNTSTANALRKLQHEYLPKNYPERRILGVIRPVVEVAVARKYKKIGVLATQATVIADSYALEIAKFNKNIQVFQKACPLFVPVIEAGEMEWEGIDLLVRKYLRELPLAKLDGLILGCTHYGLIEEKIMNNLPQNIEVISQAKATAEKFVDYLKRHTDLEKKLAKHQQRKYYVSDLNQGYEDLVRLFLGRYFINKDKLELVNL